MGDQYVYTGLPSDHHIRILQIQPSLDPSYPLHCDLINLDLNKDNDGYEALSYTWGAHVFSEPIVIGGSDVIHVTSHLAAAVRHFRLPLQPRRIWADAVCINQTDDPEKSTQIPLMSRIYRCASRVLVWLGIGHELAVRSINFHGRLLQSQPRGLDVEQKASLNAALVQLLGLSWFRRRWIIQEVVLNQDVNLFSGIAEVSWLCLLTTIDHLKRALPNEIWETADSLMTMFNLWKYKVLRDSKQGGCGILPLMVSFDQFDCFDSRDRIFAIAALADDTLILSHAVNGARGIIHISTDYSLGTEEVYVNFAASAILSGHLTWLLRQAVARRNPRARILPPWAPDWRNPVSRRPLHNHHNVTMAEFSGDAKSRFSALKVSVDFYDKWQNVYRSASSDDEFLPRGASQVVELELSGPTEDGSTEDKEQEQEQDQEHFSQRDRVRSAMDKLGWQALSTQKFVPLEVEWKSETLPSTQREASIISWIRRTCASLWTHVMKSVENNDYLVDHFGIDDTDSVAELKLDQEQHKWLSYSLVDVLGDRWSTSSQGGYNSKETSRYPVMERCPWDDPWGEEDQASVLCYAETGRGRKQRRCAVHIIESLLKNQPCEQDGLSSLLRAISEVMASRRLFAGAGVMMTRENYKLFEMSLGVGDEELREGDHIVSPVAERFATKLQAEAHGFSSKPLTYIMRHHHGSGYRQQFELCFGTRPHVYRFVGECRVRLNTLKLEVGASFWNSSDVTRDTVAGRYDRTVFKTSHLRHDELIRLRFD